MSRVAGSPCPTWAGMGIPGNSREMPTGREAMGIDVNKKPTKSFYRKGFTLKGTFKFPNTAQIPRTVESVRFSLTIYTQPVGCYSLLTSV